MLIRGKRKANKQISTIKKSRKENQKTNYSRRKKKRIKRLIELGVILDSYIDGSEKKKNEEIQEILDQVFRNRD